MFFQMLRSHIPKSLRAGIALVVMLVALYAAFSSLPALVADAPDKPWTNLVVGLLVGLPAMVCFYYFQSKDGSAKSLDDIAINALAEAGKKPIEITPAHIPEEPLQTPKPKV